MSGPGERRMQLCSEENANITEVVLYSMIVYAQYDSDR